MRLFLTSLIAGASLMFASSAAMAVTTVVTPTPAEFTALAAYSASTGGGTFNLGVNTYTADVSGIVLSPFSGTGNGTPQYYAAGPSTGPVETVPNPAVLTFGGMMSDFSFLWGSPDSYNIITFANSVAGTSVTLAQLIGASVSSLYTQSGAVFVSITGIAFDSVSFYSSSQAVEFASISAIPIPAGLPLLGAGLALLGFLGFRRKRLTSAAVA